jgi:transcriptional regulator with XRE-family HTH domain
MLIIKIGDGGNRMNFNEKLTSLRKGKGLSQEQLADLIHVSRQAISKWETSESQPDLAKMILLSNVFEVSLDELCGRTSAPPEALQTEQSKNHKRLVWMIAAGITLCLVVGIIGGMVALDILHKADAAKEIQSVSVTSFYMNPELYNHNLHVDFRPNITAAEGSDADRYSYKVLKIDSTGKSYSYPAVLKDGVCSSDVTIDFAYGDFTLNAVISDGINDYTVLLVKVSGMNDMGYSYQELWN